MAGGALRPDRVLVGALAAVAALGACWAGHPVHGAIGAVGLWFGTQWLLDAAVRQKTQLAKADADAPAVPLAADLSPVLDRLERTRVEMSAQIERRVRRRVPLALAVGVLGWTWWQFGDDPPGPLVLGILAGTSALLGWAWAVGALSARYVALYKAEVLPRLAAGFGALTYRPAELPDRRVLKEQRLFKRFDAVRGTDEIVGTIGGVPVSVVELQLVDTAGENDRTVFDGLFVRLTLPRALTGTTAVVPDGGVLGILADLFGTRGAARVRVEDPAFEAAYQVHGTDQIAARALLTPAFMERFLSLGERTGFMRPVALAEDNRLTIALPKSGYGDMFEPPDYARPATSRAALAKLHADLSAVLRVCEAVTDLDQSIRGGGPYAPNALAGHECN